MSMVGRMVRGAGVGQMLLVEVKNGIGKCLFVDHDGVVVDRFHYVAHLEPMTTAMGSRSRWPDIGRFDQIEIEKEELRAAEERRLARRAARRGKPSLKIRRRKVTA
jgi:hypothetical protein